MKIVVNAIPLLSRMTGIGNCIYNLARYLLRIDCQNQYLFYYGYFSDKLQSSQEPGEEIRELKFNILKKSKPHIKKLPFLGEMIKKGIEEFNKFRSIRKNIDIYYEPNYIPAGIQAKRIITTIHDFSFHKYPEWHPRDRINYFRKYFYTRIAQSDLITTDSQYIKQEAQEIIKFPNEKIKVVPMGVEKEIFKTYPQERIAAFRRARNLPKKFILFVGSIEPRKNIERLLLAYLELPEYLKKEYTLVLAGFSGWKNKSIMQLIAKLEKHVCFLGYLNVIELAMSYNAASLFAYPSLYEGFGLPPLEAMACGAPVLVSRLTSLPEVCGQAAEYCDPLDKYDIAGKMQILLENESLRQALSLKGEEQIKKYTWKNAARKLIGIFNKFDK